MSHLLKKVGFFGGSFNPPHVAHIMVVSYALSCHDLEKVIIVPCYNHPFQKNMVSFEHRFEMAKIAFEIFSDRIIISDIEKRIGGISYTINTISAIMKEMGNPKIYLIAGSDIIKEKDKWKDLEKLSQLVDFIYLPRGRYPENLNKIIKFPAISSSMIRQRIKKGISLDGIVPYKVLEYIKKFNLYS